MEWKEYKLGDLLINFDKKRKPLSSKERSTFKGNYRYYGAQGVIDYVRDYIFDGDYMLIAEDGENLNSRNEPIAQLVSGQFWVNNHAHIVQTNDKANLYYVMRLLNSMNISAYITGAAQPKLNQDNLNRIVVNLPDKATQDRIASILSSLDRKIELNNQINKQLEEMAQAIFKSWFVDFEPFKNGEFVESELGRIPKGWRVGTIDEYCRVFTGRKNTNEAITNGEYPFFSCAPDPLSSNNYLHDGFAIIIAGNGSYTGRTSFYEGRFDLYQRTYACVSNNGKRLRVRR